MWNKKLWGIEYTTELGEKIIISNLWHSYKTDRKYYHSEPIRAMLFCTRKAAREWIKSDFHSPAARGELRVVRVRETVRKI